MRRTAFQALASLKEEDFSEEDDSEQTGTGQRPANNDPSDVIPNGDPSQPAWKHSLLFPSSNEASVPLKSPTMMHDQSQQLGGEPFNFGLPQDLFDEHWFHHHM